MEGVQIQPRIGSSQLVEDGRPVSDDQAVAGIREAPEVTPRQRGGQPVGFGWWDGGILRALENPDVGTDLHQGEAPRPPFEDTVPGIGVNTLFNRLTDGVEVQTANAGSANNRASGSGRGRSRNRSGVSTSQAAASAVILAASAGLSQASLVRA